MDVARYREQANAPSSEFTTFQNMSERKKHMELGPGNNAR